MNKVFNVTVPFEVEAVFEVVAEDEKAALEIVRRMPTYKWFKAIREGLAAGNCDVVNEEKIITEDWGDTDEETTVS
ncbi:hypothetical protein LCGC14_1904470 [marine sediment metagenome]|uniref:Uncharacterized protein n=1 Tax=marine sediment metagenome TaxID=412755 RepID=A0A0F9FVX1_9ZZZZ